MNIRLRKKIFSAVCLLLVSALLLGSASYAWLVLSARPEVSSVTTNISANGTLEIALGKNIGESRVGDAFEKSGAVQANRTWGNLIDLRDESYGLQVISLRPAMLNAVGGAVNTLHPFAAPVYGTDGRVEKVYGNNIFAGTYDGSKFVTGVNEYGVRGVGAAVYVAPGVYDTFGPLSQRQVTYENARYGLADYWSLMRYNYISLCDTYNTQKVLKAYCMDGTGVAASDFDLDYFAEQVDNVVSAANEELKLNFTMLAAAESTPSENYFAAMELLQEAWPDYESVRNLVDSAIRAEGITDATAAIAELRAFQNAATQLRTVMDSGTIDGSDGYSMEEIAQTVGLIFDLEQTSVIRTRYYDVYYYYSSVVPELTYDTNYYDYSGSSVYNLTYSNGGGQDAGSRSDVASHIAYTYLGYDHDALLQENLNKALADLYVSHWSYWDTYKSQYDEVAAVTEQISQLDTNITTQQERLADVTEEIEELEQQLAKATDPSEKDALQSQLTQKQTQADTIRSTIAAGEAERLEKAEEQSAKEAQLLSNQGGETYDFHDDRLEAIRTVMTETIEALRKYTLWGIAYFACDGEVPDDAFHRMQEIAESSSYIHPRTAYRELLNYGVAPDSAVTQLVEFFERMETELLFLPESADSGDTVTWLEISAELERFFGTFTHDFDFHGGYYRTNYEGKRYWVSTDTSYTTEDTAAPAEVMTRIREERAACEEDSDYGVTHYYSITYHGEQLWAQALGQLLARYISYNDDYYHSGEAFEHTMMDWPFTVSYSMKCVDGIEVYAGFGVGSEENFNESGLTVRQTRFQTARGQISNYQGQLINAAVNADQSLVTLLMDMISGQDSFSTATLSAYLTALQQQVEYADDLLYRAALAMAASDYADDDLYWYAYSSNAPKDAAGLIQELEYYSFDETVLAAFTERLDLLTYQKSQLSQSVAMLADAGDQVTAAEAAAILDPVLDTAAMVLYGYVEDARKPESTAPATYQHTLLYEGFGSPAVQVSGTQAVIGGGEPVTVYPDVYLALGRSLSGALLALAKPQVELYVPPTGSVSAEDIAKTEAGLNRKGYSIGEGAGLYTVNLCTMDMLYAPDTDLWTFTGNTGYISANNEIVDLYGYCVDLSLRTNAVSSDLLLQTDAVNRIYDGEEVKTDTAMGAGSFMEFTVADYSSYTIDMAKEYMSCIRVAITDTNTGYIYAYAALDMNAEETLGLKIKAPLRLYAKYNGQMLTGSDSQYICRMDQNLEKNLSVYVYLDGAKASQDIASAYEGNSLSGVLNLQFSSSADLQPAMVEKLR